MRVMKIYLELFYTFFKIGLFTFGGGWAMISIIQREIVEHHRWIAKEDFLDLLAIAQSMPGILAVNISTVVGDRLRGVKGSIAAALGTILPSFIIILLIAIYLTPDAIKNNEVLTRIFKGIRPAVVALIAAPVFKMAKTAKISWSNFWIPVVATLLIWLLGVSPVIIILVAGVGGFIYGKIKGKKETKK